MNRAAASRTPLYPLLSVLVLDAMVHTTVSTPNTNNENGECAVDPSVTKNTLLDDDVFNTVFLPSLWLSARCRAPPPVIVPNFTRLGSRPWYFAVPLPRKEQQAAEPSFPDDGSFDAVQRAGCSCSTARTAVYRAQGP